MLEIFAQMEQAKEEGKRRRAMAGAPRELMRSQIEMFVQTICKSHGIADSEYSKVLKNVTPRDAAILRYATCVASPEKADRPLTASRPSTARSRNLVVNQVHNITT